MHDFKNTFNIILLKTIIFLDDPFLEELKYYQIVMWADSFQNVLLPYC